MPNQVLNPDARLKLGKMVLSIGNDRNMMADGYTCQIWAIDSPTDKIIEASSTDVIWNSVVWFAADEDKSRFRKVMSHVEAKDDFAPAVATLDRVLADPGTHHCYQHYFMESALSKDAGIWLCSPANKLLVFIDFKN